MNEFDDYDPMKDYDAARTRERPRAKPTDVDGRRWRPERTDKKWLYRYLDAVMERNAWRVKFSKLMDMALLNMFAPHDPKCAELLAKDLQKYKIKWPDAEKDEI